MKLDPLTAISPIDGRYWEKVKDLSQYFSESALIKYRIQVEVLYLIELSEFKVIRRLTLAEKKLLISLYKTFNINSAKRVKQIERVTNHDVKSVEYFIKEKIENSSLKDVKEYIHFALTSWDVNNLANSLMIQDCLHNSYLPTLKTFLKELDRLTIKYASIPMLSRTHGQPASPTTMGKELAVFSHRIKVQIKTIPQLTGKLNGAVGNYNAHHIAFPKADWIKFSTKFIRTLTLKPNLITTQIDDYDSFAQFFHVMVRINNILIDFDRDMWTYISLEYLKQRVDKAEVGSSTMPHKVNPIDFENSEGNLGIANSILNHLANKLPISRLQRDLTDSTATRNIGVIFAHTLLAFNNSLNGLHKIGVNKQAMKDDLENHPEVISEAIQTILRRERAQMPYEKLKGITRGKKISLTELHRFIDDLEIAEKLKDEMKLITPETYIGEAKKLAKLATQDE